MTPSPAASGPVFSDILIVGAGHAGAQTAIALRQLGFEGRVTIVGDEPEYPYERPPLSKEYLAGEKEFERILIRPPAFWEERGIDIRRGHKAVRVDGPAHRVELDDGSVMGFGRLVWAAGGRPRRLSCAGEDLAGVHTVRCRADVDAMKAELDDVNRVVVIGGGYIGLEAAAVLRKLGKQIVLLEALDRVLNRVAGEPLSRFYEGEHRAQGVVIHTGVRVDSILGGAGRVRSVRLADGTLIPAEMVIIGVGILPAVEPLIEAGAMGANGVDVDAHCRTSLADIYAIGDCAAHVNRFAGGQRVRVESVQNANDQANVAARTLVGQEAVYDAVPWFWSNQYDLRLQSVGLSIGHDEAVLRGDPGSRRFSIVYLKQGRVIALDCVNAVKDYVQGRRLVEDGVAIPSERLREASVPLKDLISS